MLHGKSQQEKQKITGGVLYRILFLLLLVSSSHVVLHAAVCDKDPGASVSRTPGGPEQVNVQ